MKKSLLPFILLLFIGFRSNSQIIVWDTLANIPKALSFPVVVELNNEIHVIGGGSSTGASTLHLRYKPVTNVWDTLAPVPYLAQQPSGAVLNGKIHFFGGGYPNSGTPLTTHYVYDPTLNSWSSSAALPIARVIMEAASINGKLYAISGQPNKMRVDEYNPGTNSWTLKNPLPDNNFWYSALVVHNNEMYRFGGGGYLSPVASIDRYDSISDSWTNIATLPVALHAPAGTSMNGLIYLSGGYSGSDLSSARAFDVNTLSFNNITSLPVARSYHEMVTIGNCIYSVGGNNNSVPAVSTSLLRYCKTISTVDIDKINLDETITLFPNPASVTVYIKSNTTISLIEMFDVSGKQVLKEIPSSLTTEIDLSQLDTGVYFVTIYSDGKISHRKIVKG